MHGSAWPDLPYAEWRSTAASLHLWTQIVGKVRLMLTPWVNHGWQVPLYVTARGLGTSPIPVGDQILEGNSISFGTGCWRAPVSATSGCSRSNRKQLPTSTIG
jgi:hypothetical protein